MQARFPGSIMPVLSAKIDRSIAIDRAIDQPATDHGSPFYTIFTQIIVVQPCSFLPLGPINMPKDLQPSHSLFKERIPICIG
jgi:hypothetical protein